MSDPAPPTPDWLEEFAIPATSSGAVLALDLDGHGLWAARLDRNRTVEAVITEPRITASVLDLRIASYLRDSETVDGAQTPAGFAELLTLCPQAREKLYDRDSALILGEEHLRVVTVSLDTVMAATVPEVNRAHGMIVDLARREPVAAVFLGPGIDDWPGLWEALSDRGYALLLPEDLFPETFAGDETGTGAFESVPSGPMPLAWAAAEASRDEAAAADPDLDLDLDLDPPIRHRTTRLGAAVAITLVIVGGLGIGLVARGASDQQSATSTPAAAGNESRATAPGDGDAAATVAVAESDEVRAARAPMRRYRAPVTTETTTSTTSRPSEAAPGPEPRPRPANPRRTIPNPIPGLPPIIIG